MRSRAPSWRRDAIKHPVELRTVGHALSCFFSCLRQSEKKKKIICEDQRSACESHMPTECIVARRASAEMQYITSLSYGQSVTDFATTLEASSNKQVSAAMPARLYYWSPPFVKSPTSWKPSFGSQRPRRSTLAICGSLARESKPAGEGHRKNLFTHNLRER